MLSCSTLLTQAKPLSSIFAQQLRFLKYHRTSIELSPKKALRRKHINLRLSYEGGVRLIMKKILRDNPFVCWGHDTLKKKEKRLNYPL